MSTIYFLNLIMGNIFGTAKTPGIPAKYYVALSTTTPNTDGTGVTEPPTSSSGYARVELTSLSAPADGVIKNSSAVSFAESLSDWGVITHYAVYDAETGGNLLFYNALEAPRTAEAGTLLMFKANELTLTLENAAA